MFIFRYDPDTDSCKVTPRDDFDYASAGWEPALYDEFRNAVDAIPAVVGDILFFHGEPECNQRRPFDIYESGGNETAFFFR
jgi:hypothetical protein